VDDDRQEELRTVGTSTLELDSSRSTVHENVSFDNTSSLSASEDIEKGSLSGTRGTHESGKRSWLDVTVDIGQQLPLAALHGDVVVEIFPCKRLRSHGKRGKILLQFALVESLASLSKTLVALVEDLVGLMVDDDRQSATAVVEVLDEDHLQEHEEAPESDEDTKVSPDVAVGVSIAGVHVIVAVDRVLTDTGTDKRTKLVRTDVVGETSDTS